MMQETSKSIQSILHHTTTPIELSIVMPCLNEAKTIGACILKARTFLDRYAVKGEIIIADNGSVDDSVRIAFDCGARVVSVSERGYGAALTGGISAAHGRYVIMGDADNSYDFSDLMPILDELRQGADMVIGNRFQGGIKKGAMPFLNRYLGNPILSAIGRLFFHIPIRDFHCGIRGFSKAAWEKLGLRTTGMEYASEMIVAAALNQYKIKEVPVVLWPDGRDRPPHLSRWRDGWRHLRFLLLYSPRWLYLYPGLAMIGLGLILALLLLPGPIEIGGVGLDVHTLLIGSMSILLGLQSITFGFMARSYALSHGILPDNRPNNGWIKSVTLEKLLILSAILILIGFGSGATAFHQWSVSNFGALDYRNAMRFLIVSITFIVAGFQMGFSAFLLGVMQIKLK